MKISNGVKYHIITFGCQMNKSDSERIATVLESIGYQPTPHQDWWGVDLIVVNMCSVRQSAVDRVYGLIPKFEKLKAQNSPKQSLRDATGQAKLKTILTGCILKEDKRKFAKGFDSILNIKDLPNWPKILKENKNSIIQPWQINKFNCEYLKIKPKYENNFRASIPISNGCNWACAYCVVPFTRGRLVCRDHKEILTEARDAVQKGFKEIWLLGQNVNDYTSPTDNSINFAKLLEMVNDIPGNFWVRFTSPHPKNFTDELIEAMRKSQKVAKYLNLPVQSGDNKILKKMNRPYMVKQYKDLVKKIRKKIPDINLSTDVIVGFPGETKKQFENTLKLFKEIKFNLAYIAKYSPRPGTTAFKMRNDVPLEEKKRREKNLREILKK